MNAIFKETDGDYLPAKIEFAGVDLVVMDNFGGNNYVAGDEINIEITAGLLYESEDWDSMFASNQEGRKQLEHIVDWQYRAYGVITRIKPDVTADVGVLELEVPLSTNDSAVIGEHIAFTITRLDAHPI